MLTPLHTPRVSIQDWRSVSGEKLEPEGVNMHDLARYVIKSLGFSDLL